MTHPPLFQIQTAHDCAWRAIYVSVRTRQICFLGIDPTSTRPHVFGGILSRHFHIDIPFVAWRYSQSSLRTRWQLWLSSIDGRRIS